MIKKITAVFFLFMLTFVLSGYKRPDVYKIDAEQNAYLHNNFGLKAVADENYYEAIQQFTLAILLNPKKQSTAVYYNNLGETYMKVGCYKEAQKCFESAITQYNLNFLYYQNLVKTFKAQKIVDSKIKLYKANEDKNSMNIMMLGLLYVAKGDVKGGIIKLDEFAMREPDLLISGAVRGYIKEIIPKE